MYDVFLFAFVVYLFQMHELLMLELHSGVYCAFCCWAPCCRCCREKLFPGFVKVPEGVDFTFSLLALKPVSLSEVDQC